MIISEKPRLQALYYTSTAVNPRSSKISTALASQSASPSMVTVLTDKSTVFLIPMAVHPKMERTHRFL